MDNFIFVFLSKTSFLSRAVQSHPTHPLGYATNVSQNYIPLSDPHYIHHIKYTQKVDKPMINVMIASEADIRKLI